MKNSNYNPNENRRPYSSGSSKKPVYSSRPRFNNDSSNEGGYRREGSPQQRPLFKRKFNNNRNQEGPAYSYRTHKAPPEQPLQWDEMPLNKFLAHCGLASRRKTVDFVKEGKVTVNGKVILEPAFRVSRKDEVAYEGKRVTIRKNLVYLLLNKPKGFITTTEDPEGRKTVMELVKEATQERIFPVGRLDRNTSGLLLLTNDGELAQRLAHPKHNVKKVYQVGLDKELTKEDFEKILKGVELEDGLATVDAMAYVDIQDKTQVGLEIHSGKNRIVRRIFEHLGYRVEKLDRVLYAGLTKKNVPRGKWRFLSEKEIVFLKHFK